MTNDEIKELQNAVKLPKEKGKWFGRLLGKLWILKVRLSFKK